MSKKNNFSITKDAYKTMVDEKIPKSNTFRNCFRAFWVGGTICVIAEFIKHILLVSGISEENAGGLTSVVLIFISIVLTGFGIYQKIGNYAGAGSVVPITGFANSVASPAIEFKKEGFVMGVGAKIFIIAGPVILYGTVTSIIVGIVYYFSKIL